METPSPGGSLARGAAVITVATALSRATGFLRVVVVAAAMGTTFLANTYQTANTIPNVVFELVAAGVLTSVFVPTFVAYLAAGRGDETWEAADALTSVALVALVAIAALVAGIAPWLMQLLTITVTDERLRAAEIELGTTLLRLFAPQVVFYGVGMIMTSALHAHRRFTMAAVAPIFNNVVVIGVYIAYAVMRRGAPSVGGITTAETMVLGAGTTMGVVAMTLCLLPSLRATGWRFRFRFRPRHPAVRKASRLGAWALGYAGGYQAGLIVVLLLANGVEGGVAAYQWAYTLFYVPHALFGAPIFHVLFPAMSEHVARGEQGRLVHRLEDGMKMLAFIMLPVTVALLAVADPLTEVVLGFGVMSPEGTTLVARVLSAFVVGLPGYSAFLVLTRAFYALSDTKTPTLVNAGSIALFSCLGTILFFLVPRGWSVAALAFAHSIAFSAGVVVLGRLLSRRLAGEPALGLRASLLRAALAAGLAFGAMAAVVALGPEGGKGWSAAILVVATALGAAIYLGAMSWLQAPEVARLRTLIAGQRG